jgi:hypothetical protein
MSCLTRAEQERPLGPPARVNFNVRTVIASVPLDDFAKAHQGVAAQLFEQKLEGKWEQPSEGGNAK